MATIGFVNPWFLAAAPLAALPVAIHFLTRARPRPIRYPTLRFLREAGGGTQALHRLRLIALLTLRCLAVLAAVLAFSRPYLRAPGVEDVPGARRRVVLLVDASMSMRASRGGVSHFAKARAEAAEVLASLEAGSEAAVVFIGARPRPVLPALSENIPELHEALATARPTMELGRADLALALAGRMLDSGGGDGGGSVYVFSDFQRTNWAAAPLETLEGVAVLLRPVMDAPAPNVAVTSVSVFPEEPVAGELVDLACTVFNCTGSARRESVGLLVEGEGIALDAPVELKAYSSAEVSFRFSLPRPGEFAGTVSVSPDDLPEDNARYFSIRVREELNALVVSDADPDDRAAAAFYLATALSPSERAATGLSVSRRDSQDVDQAAIDRADAIIVAAPATLPGRVAEAVAERVSAGADLMCCLDGPTSPAILGALSGASGGSVSAPFRLVAPAPRSREPEPLGEMDLASRVLAAFGDAEQGDLSQLVFTRHHRTEVVTGRTGEVLIYHRDGSAALALSPAGRGRAVFTNMPFTMDGGNLVARGLFPALVAELMRALRRGDARAEARPGEDWFVEIAASGSEAAGYRVVAPDGETEVPSSVVASGRTVRLAISPVAAPGHYRVLVPGGLTAAAGAVVNVDAKESDTREVPLHYAAESGGGAVAVVDDEGALALAGTARPMWDTFAGLAALFIAAEMVLLALWRRPARRAVEQRFVGGAA